MSSQSELELYEFLQKFSPISLHYKKPKFPYHPWVFWSKYEGCENNSTSADVGTPINIHDKIISALSNICFYGWNILGQFWAPVTIGGRRLLSTSAQPFAVDPLSNKLAKYRLNSEKYKYNIDIDDANKFDIELDQMIKSGGPATAFLNCRTSMSKLPGFLSELDYYGILNFSVMIPICFPSQTNCIGVLEFTFHIEDCYLADFIYHMVKAIKEAGLDVFYVQHLIPYTTINGLKVVKEEIEEALKVVGKSHNLALAQVWIPYEDTNNVPFSHALEDTQTKQLLAIKLAGYLYSIVDIEHHIDFEPYFRYFDTTPCGTGDELRLVTLPDYKSLPLVTLQDYKSRYISKLHINMKLYGQHSNEASSFAICLRSNVTSEFNYVFEFIWIKQSNYFNLLKAILLTLKRCLPRFKFASGEELGDELIVIDVEKSTHDIPEKFKIFQGKRSSLMPEAREEAKRTTVVDYIAPSKVTCKTTLKVLPREDIEKQFGNTMKDAAKNLKVSVSTLKRKCKDLGIPEWQGPSFVKRNANGSSLIQSSTNEEDDGAIEGTPTINLHKNVLTIKAKYTDYMIKLHIPISQATFEIVEKRIGMKLKLSVGTFKLEYIDEDEDWISLASDEDMDDCVRSSNKSDRIVARLRVLPSPQPISGPSGSLETFFM